MTHEEIEKERQDLLCILKKEPESSQNQLLRDIAKKNGAQQPNASGVEFRDMIVSNINNALQTASMINMCKVANKNYRITIWATIAAVISAATALIAVCTKAIGQ